MKKREPEFCPKCLRPCKSRAGYRRHLKACKTPMRSTAR